MYAIMYKVGKSTDWQMLPIVFDYPTNEESKAKAEEEANILRNEHWLFEAKVVEIVEIKD